MQFTTVLALALPLVAALPQATPTTSVAAPSSTPDLEATCEAQASSYKDACPRCLHNCADSAYPDQCYYSVFFTINGIQADCQAHGGVDCRNKAIDMVCGQ
ncbi:hypothetical protein SAMD00023353_4300390 [Rosellinia necatrix]|uniref:Uncharacterized protein n=1 Tax=Rosellinia necatrix TaxID=77044 RepID=A0A1W2TNP9_ROSNE|nr:hypothetical protein SAMD00023353_4300390 [Rosellinia necatrix]